MTSARRAHAKKERQAKRRARKVSVYDRLIPWFAAAALLLLIVSVIVSAAAGGQGRPGIGAAGMAGLVLSAGGFILWLMVHLGRNESKPDALAGARMEAVLAVIYIVLLFMGI